MNDFGFLLSMAVFLGGALAIGLWTLTLDRPEKHKSDQHPAAGE